jgi:Ca2+-binding EF-hand superfamily protein
MDGLKQLMSALDLDDALNAAREIDLDNADVQATVRDVINNKWSTDKQAVYNLLQNCYVIPEDIRFSTLMKGIEEPNIRAYNLAAVVGLQDYRCSPEELPIAKQKLFQLASSDSVPANARALTSLSDSMSKFPEDVATYLRIYATATDNSVKYGARASILRYYINRPKEEFVEAIKAQNLFSPEDLDSLASTHGNASLTFGHLSYIPNLSEIEPMERYRARILSLFDGVDLAKKGKLTVAEFCEFLRAVGNSTITVEKAAEMIKQSKGYLHFDDCTFVTRADWYDLLQGKLRFKDIDYPPW